MLYIRHYLIMESCQAYIPVQHGKLSCNGLFSITVYRIIATENVWVLGRFGLGHFGLR